MGWLLGRLLQGGYCVNQLIAVHIGKVSGNETGTLAIPYQLAF